MMLKKPTRIVMPIPVCSDAPTSRTHFRARGTQTRICRVIAVVMIGLGAIPLALIGSSVGPQGFRDRLVAVIIAACCLVMATFWLKPRWPSRAQSVLCVVIGTVCIAAASVITPSPVVGLFGTTAFAVVAAYTACFHTGRLLTFTWTVAGATVIILAVRLAAPSIPHAHAFIGVVFLRRQKLPRPADGEQAL